ncbi:MAG TPA: RNA polymerase sigma factor [Solirubrobacteraceae bacterium]|nr:RNA polymerase sigma factor [Solirubrobacteraceae bacterium]
MTRDHGLRDQDEFERMFRTHHDAVRAYALRRTAVDDANDIVAETFLVAWRRFDEAPRDFLLAWLFGVARRVLANQRRASNRRDTLVDRLGTVVTASPAACDVAAAYADHVGAASASFDGALAEALARLTADDRELLLLVAWEGLRTDEAARALGCRPATCRMRLHRARRRLATLLDEPDAGPPAAISPAFSSLEVTP